MPRTELHRTASFRIGLFYAALFTVSVLVLFVVIYFATAGYVARQLVNSINEELTTLQTDLWVGGRETLMAEVVSRLNARTDQSRHYLLQSPEGRVVAGDIGPLPPQPGWIDLTEVGNPSASGHIRARGVVLMDGSYLLVGQDATRLEELEHRIRLAFLWGTAATLVLAIVGALLMSAVSLRRVDAIGRAVADIVAGNLARRLPALRTGDEFDRLSTQVNLMLDRIQSLMSGLQQVSNDIAHDLKTPLTRLRQGLELARHRATSQAEYENAVDRAIVECDRTLSTFDALLRIAQIEAGTRRAGFQSVDLAPVIETIFEAYLPVAEETGHTLTVAAAEPAPVRGDRALITQMLANLMENALRHTPAGSTITLAWSAGAGQCRLTVADNGPGIPEAERGKVFQRFYRLDASRSTAGSGLGLSLVAAIAHLHEASVTLSDNAPGLRVTVVFARDSM